MGGNTILNLWRKNKMDKHENIGIPYYLSVFAQDKEQIKMAANKGYVIAPQKIIRCFRLNDIEKVLLLELLSYMGANDYAFPSHKRLAFKLGKKSTASIKNALRSLKDKGFIDWRKGGGDIGSNRYTLNDLYSNPYLIISEFTHFFVEEILDAHRDEISYEDIYSTVLEIAEKPKNTREANDPYGICIDWLFKDINLRDRLDMYWLFGDILRYNISVRSGIPIQIDGFSLADKYFERNHPDIVINYGEDHPIHKDLKDPFSEQPFEVRAAEVSDKKIEELRNNYKKVADYLDTLDERQIYKVYIEEVIMECPIAHLQSSDELIAFLEMEDIEDRIDMIMNIIEPFIAKSMIKLYYHELKQHELANK